MNLYFFILYLYHLVNKVCIIFKYYVKLFYKVFVPTYCLIILLLDFHTLYNLTLKIKYYDLGVLTF